MKKQFVAKSLAYTISSNFFALMVSVTVTLVVPKMVSVEQYGYWQLFLFYSTYMGVCHLGLLDGIYLSLGGKDFLDLDYSLLRKQFVTLLLSTTFFSALFLISSQLFVEDVNKQFVILGFSAVIIVGNVQTFFYYMLQVTSRFKENSLMQITYLSIYVILLIAAVTYKPSSILLMMACDLTGRFISVIYGAWECRRIFLCRTSSVTPFFKTLKYTVIAGASLLFANLASSLIVGSFRFEIERIWSVAIFGKVSLTISLCNFILVFLNAVGIVLFPLLRRLNVQQLPGMYRTLRIFLMSLVAVSLLSFFALKPILNAWLPKYIDSLQYMAILFPIIFFEGRMALLINPYMKALRFERKLLIFNVLAMMLGFLFAFVAGDVFGNLHLMLYFIVLTLAIRCLLNEVFLTRQIEINVLGDIVVELLIAVVFILVTQFLSNLTGCLTFAVLVLIYLLWKRTDLLTIGKKLIKQ